jgi:hypothetical protein
MYAIWNGKLEKNSFACQCLCVATEDNSGYEQLLVYLK